jgi:hypothetical protein
VGLPDLHRPSFCRIASLRTKIATREKKSEQTFDKLTCAC